MKKAESSSSRKEGSVHKTKRDIRKRGITLVELMVSTSLTTMAVLGTVSATILFAQIANNHENHFDYYRDIRIAMEQLSQDVRNATDINSRTATGFTLTYSSSGSVTYSYDASSKQLNRTEDGTTREMLSNLAVFDLLVDATDADGNLDLEFNDKQIAIEALGFETSNGSAPSSVLELSNFTFTLRNSI